MMGRASYHTPWILHLTSTGGSMAMPRATSPADIVAANEALYRLDNGQGVRLAQITRHMLVCFHGIPGGRHWRQVLSKKETARRRPLPCSTARFDEVLQRSGQFALGG